ncbi:MAG: DUF4153 domain-containing protein, partial [Gammaproteobacteria bacterium]|nr:DUF4153 domain-containing protein [Gammaproteobacteria bacterium]
AYLLAAGVPVFIYLAPLHAGEARYDAAATGLLAVLLLVMGWHTGGVLTPAPDPVTGAVSAGDISNVFVPDLLLSTVLIVFITALLFRAWRESPGEGLPWRCQLEAAWGNALTLALVLAFIVLLWALLFTWGALFSLIGIDFFRELFIERPFRYAVTGLAGGIGLVLVRSRIGLITAVRSICESLARVLAPLAAVIVLGFALALPFAGIDLLWQDGRRPTALLWLAAFTLFLTNAALGEEGFTGRLRRLQWLLGLAVMVLLPLLAVTLIGLFQRVAVFGWSGPRLWAAIVSAALVAYALAMAWSLLRQRALVPETIGRWNTALAFALVALLFAVHSPLADLRRIVAADQLARVLDGRIPTRQFDVHYVHRSLGRHGRHVLERLRNSELAGDARFLARLDRVNPETWADREAFDPAARVGPHLRTASGEALPPQVLDVLARDGGVLNNCQGEPLTCVGEYVEFAGQGYWVVLGSSVLRQVGGDRWLNIGFSRIFRERDGQWQRVGSLARDHDRCPAPAANEIMLPALHQLPDLPGVLLQIGECRYPVVWQVEPQPLVR